MFVKILIAEDHEIMNHSLRRTLEELQLSRPDSAYDCDIALGILQRGWQSNTPYDLLITDLYFEKDGTAEQLAEGENLIRAAKALQPALKILVFSAESRPPVIRALFDDLKIDGYVRKARRDAQDLKLALERLSQNQKHYPRELRNNHSANLHYFTDYDKALIRLLGSGTPQKAIPAKIAAMGLAELKISSLEKRLKTIKKDLKFSTTQELLLYCKEIGLL